MAELAADEAVRKQYLGVSRLKAAQSRQSRFCGYLLQLDLPVSSGHLHAATLRLTTHAIGAAFLAFPRLILQRDGLARSA